MSLLNLPTLTKTVPQELPPHPNLLCAQLAEDRLTATFMADDHLLAAYALTSMLRAKDIERGVLVSDVVALSDLPRGIYDTQWVEKSS